MTVRADEQQRRLSIIGRDWQIIDALARTVHKAIRPLHDHSDLRDTLDGRGRTFEVALENGRVARVTVELERVESGGSRFSFGEEA